MIERAIITGATGAIGTALIKELIANGIEVLVFTRKESNRNKNIIDSNLVKIEYYSLDELKSCQNSTNKKYDVFFHLAWAGTFGKERNNIELQEKNVQYTLDAIECCKHFGCKKFVGIGSQAEYGRANEILSEKTNTNPENEYGRAKLKAGRLGKFKAKELGIEFNWIRVLSVYGPNDGESTFISYSIKKLLENEDLEVTKCEQKWDYLYSEDAAKAILAVAEKGVNGKTYCLGSGQYRSLSEYLEIIRCIIQSKSIIKYGSIPYNDNQVMFLCADIKDLKNDCNWIPLIPFEKGIMNTIQFLTEHK